MRAILGNLKSPAGTVDSVNPPAYLLPHQVQIMQNMKMDSGLIAKRGGTVAHGSALAGTGPIQGIWIAYRADGTLVPVRYAMRGGVIYYNNSGTTWTTTTITGWSTSAFPSAAVYQGKIFFCNAVDASYYSTLSAPATVAAWGPAGIKPSWVVAFGNKLYCGGDPTNPNRVYMSDFGDPLTWQSQNFYNFPDNQNGGSAQIAFAIPKGILLYGQDFMGTLTGYSELDHEFQPWPRSSALLSRRAVFDVGGAGVSLAAYGPALFDGFSMPRQMDPLHEINWGDANLTTPNYLWGERSDTSKFRIYYQSRGFQASADSSTVTVATLMSSIWSRAVTFLTRIPAASAPTLTSHYMEYDMVTNSWSGPHTGAHTCGVWETMAHGDRQIFWVGHATSGKILKADQDTFTDDGTPYECILRTGCFGLDPFKKYRVSKCEVMCNTSAVAAAGIKVRLIYDEQPEIAAEEVDADISKVGGYDGSQSTIDLAMVDRGGYCVVPVVFEKGKFGRSPQIEVREVSDKPFVIRGISIEFEEIK